MKFNINEYVKVKLTPYGKQKLLEDHNEFWSQYGIGYKHEFILPKEDENGYSTWQLWLLMKNLGKYCNVGAELPFETDILIDIES